MPTRRSEKSLGRRLEDLEHKAASRGHVEVEHDGGFRWAVWVEDNRPTVVKILRGVSLSEL